MIRELLAAVKDLPPTTVINLGLSGEYIQRLLDSGRYEKADFTHLPGWFGDRHPNLAGDHVIGDETAKCLAPLTRKKLAR